MLHNATPHRIVIRRPEGDLPVEPSGKPARVATKEDVIDNLDGIPIVRRTFGKVEIEVPEDFTGHILVSALVLEAAKNEAHPLLLRLLAPDTGPTAIREAGQVVAVTRLVTA